MSKPRPFTAPKKLLEDPTNSSQPSPMDRIRKIHLSILQGKIQPAEFFVTLNALPVDDDDTSLAIASTLMSYLIYCKPYPQSFPELFASSFSSIIQSKDEIVRRACLPLLSLLVPDESFSTVLEEISNKFNTYNTRAKEMILAFAFCFNQSIASNWSPFLQYAEQLTNHRDELLASTASDFLEYVVATPPDDDNMEYDIPPLGTLKMRNSIDFSKHLAAAQAMIKDFEEEEEEIKEGFEEEDYHELSLPPPKRQTSEEMKLPTPENVGEEEDYEFSKPKRLINSTDEIKTVSSPIKPKKAGNLSVSVKSPKGVKSARTKAIPTGESPKKAKPKAPSIPDLVTQLRDSDWERQQEAVEILSEMLTTNPTQLSTHCKEIWLNNLDIISSPRTMLSNVALQFAATLFPKFTSQLAPQAQQYITSCLNLTCTSHQFIADGATAVLLSITENCPKSRCLSHLIAGTKHKNSIARGKALGCISIFLERAEVDDKEMSSMIKLATPLLRDTRAETRDAAKTLMKTLSKDERFIQVSKAALGPQQYTEMKKMID